MAPAARVSGQDRGAYPPPCRVYEVQAVAVPAHPHTEDLDAFARGLQRRAHSRGRCSPHLREVALRPQRSRMVRLGRVDGHAELATAQVDDNGFGSSLADVYAQECACHSPANRPPVAVPCARRASHMAEPHRSPPWAGYPPGRVVVFSGLDVPYFRGLWSNVTLRGATSTRQGSNAANDSGDDVDNGRPDVQALEDVTVNMRVAAAAPAASMQRVSR